MKELVSVIIPFYNEEQYSDLINMKLGFLLIGQK